MTLLTSISITVLYKIKNEKFDVQQTENVHISTGGIVSSSQKILAAPSADYWK